MFQVPLQQRNSRYLGKAELEIFFFVQVSFQVILFYEKFRLSNFENSRMPQIQYLIQTTDRSEFISLQYIMEEGMVFC